MRAHGRVPRWAGRGRRIVVAPDTFRTNIGFAGTRKHVDPIMWRYDFYKRRGKDVNRLGEPKIEFELTKHA